MPRSATLAVLALIAVPCAAQTLAPSNLPETTCATPGMGSLTVVAEIQIDTLNPPNGWLCDPIVDQQLGAPPICVMKFESVIISPGARVTVTGPRALALVATSQMVIDGTVDAQARSNISGPGAVAAGAGGTQSGSSGGGGAGHGRAGGNGGAGGGTMPGFPGFGALPSGTPELVPLRGGARGATAGVSVSPGRGGGGGGAVQLVSCATLSIGVTGAVVAGGGGGLGGAAPVSGSTGGSGGGSGGGILIEGRAVTVSGTLVANGGGGGAGGSGGAGTQPGPAGMDGRPSLIPALGGAGTVGGEGGNGGARATDAAGGSGSLSNGGGGGGGAVGRIRINIPADGSLDLTGAVVSPAHTSGVAALSDLIFKDGFES